MSPLCRLPENVRAYYYRLTIAAGPVAVAVAVALEVDPITAAGWTAAVTGFIAALLATANTSTRPDA